MIFEPPRRRGRQEPHLFLLATDLTDITDLELPINVHFLIANEFVLLASWRFEKILFIL